jgi:hypothetical protein
VKYDDYDYHVGGEFPDDVPDEHAWTHMGVFLIWLIEHGLHDPAFFDGGRLATAVAGIATRETHPSTFLFECDGVLDSGMLASEGVAFADACYARYLELFEETMVDHVNACRPLIARLTRAQRTAYHADPGWPTYDIMSPVIDGLHADWREGRRPAASGSWTRNYGAMGDEKLLRCIGELRSRSGDAFERVLAHAADRDVHLAAAEKAAEGRGLL